MIFFFHQCAETPNSSTLTYCRSKVSHRCTPCCDVGNTHTHTDTLTIRWWHREKKRWRVCSSQLSRCHLQEIFSAPQQRHGSQAQANTHCPFIFFLGLNSSRSHTQKRKHDQVVFHHICAQSLTPDPDRSLSRLCAPPPHHHLHPVTVMCLYVFHPQARYSTVQYSWRLCKSKLKNCCLLFLWLILQ